VRAMALHHVTALQRHVARLGGDGIAIASAHDLSRLIDLGQLRPAMERSLEELKKIVAENPAVSPEKFSKAKELLSDLVFNDEFADFLTLKAYPLLEA